MAFLFTQYDCHRTLSGPQNGGTHHFLLYTEANSSTPMRNFISQAKQIVSFKCKSHSENIFSIRDTSNIFIETPSFLMNVELESLTRLC